MKFVLTFLPIRKVIGAMNQLYAINTSDKEDCKDFVRSDRQLVELLQNGETSVFSELVKRHQRSLLNLCIKLLKDQALAEDVVQESFVKAYQKIHLFEGRSSFKSWLYQIALNTGKNKLRAKQKTFLDIEKTHLSVAPEAEASLFQKDTKDLLAKEIEKLPYKQKKALLLRIYEDLSFKEIAQIMQCPYDTAKANYRHGLMKLRRIFQKDLSLQTS